jgi:H+-transporting ATPase
MKAYIQYRIALCLHLEIYLVTSMIIINETIGVDLIVFLALFADLATIAVAYDNAHFEQRPVEWQLPKIWIISVILGTLLAMGTWVLRGALFIPNGGIVENFGNIQGILFLEVSLTENWLIFVTRGGNTWPSWQLVGAIFGVDVLSTLFCVFGWLVTDQNDPSDPATKNVLLNTHGGDTSIVTVVIIWGYSIGVTIVIAMAYFLLNQISWLDNLGRAKRSRADTQMENILSHLSKVSIAHEQDEHGGNRWHLTPKATEAEEDD